MRTLALPLAVALTLTLAGCHSAYISATVTNRTPEPLSLIELDYPSASFGTQGLAPGAAYTYRFKVLGSGPTHLLWTDAAHHDHKAEGPSLGEKDEGRLSVAIAPDGHADWQLNLINRK